MHRRHRGEQLPAAGPVQPVVPGEHRVPEVTHHQHGADALHQHQQRHEEHDDARAQVREARKVVPGRFGHQYLSRSSGGL